MRQERYVARPSKINVTARLFQPADWLARVPFLVLRGVLKCESEKEKGRAKFDGERNYFTSLRRAFQDLQLCLGAGKLTKNEWERACNVLLWPLSFLLQLQL